MSVFSEFKELASRQPDAPAVQLLDAQVSMSAVLRLAEQVAGGLLKAGWRPGDRVALHIGNRPELLSIYYACLRIGAPFVPVSPRHSGGEVGHLLTHSGARFYIGEAQFYQRWAAVVDASPALAQGWLLGENLPPGRHRPWAELLADTAPAAVEIAPDEVASIFYTSGTTGKPKGIVFSQSTFAAALAMMDATLDYTGEHGPGSTAAIYSMVDLISPWSILMALTSLRRGRPVAATQEHAPADVFQMLKARRIGWLGGAPSSFKALLDAVKTSGMQPPDLSHVHCVTGGDTCPTDLTRAFAATFGAQLQSSYGQTETGGAVIHHPNLSAADVPAIGWPLAGVEVRIDAADGEPGELLLRSPARPLGLWNGSSVDRFDPERWLVSGDLVRQRADGCLLFLGRLKDHMMVEGYPVTPLEVEQALTEHPQVAAALVFGVPDDTWGERPVALVQLEPGQEMTSTQLMGHLDGRIAFYKHPREIRFVAELPVLPTGKHSRQRLAADYLAARSGLD